MEVTSLTCLEVRERLSAFSDDELDPISSGQVTEHVLSCAECSAALADLKALRERLSENLEYHRAPDLLRARVVTGVRRAAGGPARSWPSAWRWLSTAAALVVVASGTWMVVPRTVGVMVAHEVVSSHIRSLMANHLTDVASTDQHTVKPWFNGRIDYSPPVSDFASDGFPLIGGRLDYLQDGPVAALVYQRRKHVINVFVLPNADGSERISPVRTERGYHLIHATHQRMSFWIVSDLSPTELAAFARLLTGSGPPG
jgi:anti-sigma factor RsiW